MYAQQVLFYGYPVFRSWCDKLWVVFVWRSSNGEYLGEYLVDEVR